MGNSGSKSSKAKLSSTSHGESSSSSMPPFTRTDTSQSTKSTRSLKSLRSRRSESASGSATPQIKPVKDEDSILHSSSNSNFNIPTARKDNVNRHNRQQSQVESIPQDYSGFSDNNTNINSNSNFLQPSTPNSSGKLSTSKRSSFTNADLPPSMIQMEPKSPILKNSKYTTTNSLNYSENALTDEEDVSEAAKENLRNNSATSGKSQLDTVRHNHSSRPSSVRSGSSSKVRRRSDNNMDTSDITVSQHLMTRSNSHASSVHSRKSTGSAGTTAYSTPLNSPGVRRNEQGNNIHNDEQDDYFASNSMASNPTSNTYDNTSENVNSNIKSTVESTDHTHLNSDDTVVNENNRMTHADIKNLSRRELINEYPSAAPLNSDIQDDILDEKSLINDLQQQSGVKKKRNIKPINIDETIQKLLDAGYAGKRTKNVCLKNSEIAQICHLAREMFLSQPSLLELSPPVKIVGDVHGQYADLLRLFTKCGFPPAANFLFLGDYVDRGKQSLETILLLLCYKIKYPENFFLLRGNHECANVTRVYGFYDECKRRCNIKTWKIFVDTFNTLPLAAIVAGKIFCVHGGLSPVLNSMDEIRHVSRPTDVPDFGLINDLLWSDPTDSPNEWEDNERGVSYCYNKVAINKFLNKFGFDLVCRAHMVVEDGYEFFNDRSLVTVFSAPNYCGEFDNWGAVMSVSEGLLCSFELLDPLDSSALKQVMKKGRQERKLANQQQLQVLQ